MSTKVYGYKDKNYQSRYWKKYGKPKPTAAGLLVRAAREEKGWSQVFLAAKISVTYNRICIWENGRSPIPVKYVLSLTSALNLDAELLSSAIFQDSGTAQKYRKYVNPESVILESEDVEGEE
jgi:transcriptional regulator with XRE-family HTH domain